MAVVHMWALLLVLCGINCFPVSDNADNSVAQLQQLAAKLLVVEEALKDLNQDITSFVKSEQQLHSHSEQNVASSSKRSSLSAPPAAAHSKDPALGNFIETLSPEEQAVLLHMQSKVKYLEAVLNEPEHGPNPGEEPQTNQASKKSQIPGPVSKAREFQMTNVKRSHLPNPSVPAEESDEELQTFEQQLSPQDQQLLKKMGYKLKYLQATLHEPAHEPNPNEAPDTQTQKKSHIPLNMAKEFHLTNEKRSHLPNPSVPAAESDEELQTFEQQLSPQDQQLLKKMGYKLKYLQATLHEPAHEPNPNEAPETETPAKKSTMPEAAVEPVANDQMLADYIAGLSPADQELLLKNKNKLHLLQAVIHEPPHSPNPGESDTQVPAKKSTMPEAAVEPVANDQMLADYIAGLSPADQELLLKNKNKLHLLQAVIHEPPHSPNPGESNTQAKRGEMDEEVGEMSAVPSHTTHDTAADEAVPQANDEAIVFTANDRQMLQAIRVKLDELKKSLHEFKMNHAGAETSVDPVEEGSPEKKAAETAPSNKPKVKEEGEFGEFVQIRSKRGPESHWHDSPVDENLLGLVAKKCENCSCDDEQCDCGCECTGDCPGIEAKVTKRVLSKVNSAAPGDINLKQLLNALGHVKEARQRRYVNVEQELDQLREP